MAECASLSPLAQSLMYLTFQNPNHTGDNDIPLDFLAVMLIQ